MSDLSETETNNVNINDERLPNFSNIANLIDARGYSVEQIINMSQEEIRLRNFLTEHEIEGKNPPLLNAAGLTAEQIHAMSPDEIRTANNNELDLLFRSESVNEVNNGKYVPDNNVISEGDQKPLFEQGKLSELFGNVTSIYDAFDTPKEVMGMVGKFLGGFEKMPSGKVIAMLENVGTQMFGEGHALDIMENLPENVKEHLFDDAFLDKSELADILSDVGKSLHDSRVDEGLVNQASEMLKRLGIEDPKGEIATGLAKLSVHGAVSAQMMKEQLENMPNEFDGIPVPKEGFPIVPEYNLPIFPEDIPQWPETYKEMPEWADPMPRPYEELPVDPREEGIYELLKQEGAIDRDGISERFNGLMQGEGLINKPAIESAEPDARYTGPAVAM